MRRKGTGRLSSSMYWFTSLLSKTDSTPLLILKMNWVLLV